MANSTTNSASNDSATEPENNIGIGSDENIAIDIIEPDGNDNVRPTRKRGRPRKTAYPQTETETAEKPAQATVTKRGRKPRSKKYDKNKADELAKFIMTMQVSVSSMALKQDTSFTEVETMILEPSLSEMIQKMDVSQIERASAIIAPISVIAVNVFWVLRQMRTLEQKRQENTPTENENQNHNANLYANGLFQ